MSMIKEQDILIQVEDTEEEETRRTLAEPQATVPMNVRKTIDGNIMIRDHEDVDIVVFPGKNKIVVFPKNIMDDKVYGIQSDFFNYMFRKGCINQKTIKAGDAYFSLQADIPESSQEGIDPVQLCVFVINKWIEQERPYFMKAHAVEDEHEKSLTDPPDDETTPLGKVPQKRRKGTIDPRLGMYGWNYNYSVIRENLMVLPGK